MHMCQIVDLMVVPVRSSSFLIITNSLLILLVALLYASLVAIESNGGGSGDMATLNDELRNNPIDPNSFARPDQARVTHLDLRWTVDFDRKVISGRVVLTVKRVDSTATSLNLDSLDLAISGVSRLLDDDKQTVPIPYTVHSPVPSFGSKLQLDISSIREEDFRIQVDYQTSPESRALMWMAPAMTAGQRHPFMYSQCQAINARALVPCQDTPSVKATYRAEVSAPEPIRVLMSAKVVGDPEPAANGTRMYRFEQKVPIPGYLIAIAAGDLAAKRIGPISHVWAEPSVLEQAAWEFVPTESFLETAESLAGPYVWEVYDILVLPPSFPYGGMENPCLTFATPTLLAGDRSLVDVIAHEIAHSWTGNLVTNANFGHFWLNEGFTMFLERKILGRLHGEPTRQLSALEGIQELRTEIQNLGESSPFSQLLIDVRGINPDDVFSIIPYEKGHTFLYYLEQRVGGPAAFEPFLKTYIDHFKYRSIVTDDFKRFFLDYFRDKTTALADIDWQTWLYSPGMPPVIPDYDQTLLAASVNLATKWLEAPEPTPEQFGAAEFESLSPPQRKLFFMQMSERLNRSRGMPVVEKLAVMAKQYPIGKNCEIQHAWLMLAIQARYEAAVPDAVGFLSTYGRMKYLKPLYRALYQWDKTRQLALDTFQANQPHMMSVAIEAIAQVLKP